MFKIGICTEYELHSKLFAVSRQNKLKQLGNCYVDALSSVLFVLYKLSGKPKQRRVPGFQLILRSLPYQQRTLHKIVYQTVDCNLNRLKIEQLRVFTENIFISYRQYTVSLYNLSLSLSVSANLTIQKPSSHVP